MAETATVPGVGKVPKKELTIGLVVVGTLVAVYYYRKQQTSSTTTAAAAATTTDQYPPDGTVGNPQDLYSTDPATNQTYGDEASGSGGTYGAYGYNSYDSSSGIIGYDSAGNPVYAPGYAPSGTTTGTTGGPPFANNAAWSQYVIAQMTANNPSQDVGALTDAIGLYLSGQPVDASQQQLIFDAIAIGENPPVAGPTGYPPKVQLNGNKGGTGSTGGGSGSNSGGSTGGGSSGGGSTGNIPQSANPNAPDYVPPVGGIYVPAGMVNVPDVLGGDLHDAVVVIQDRGLVPIAPGGSLAQQIVINQSPVGGTNVAPGTTVNLTVR